MRQNFITAFKNNLKFAICENAIKERSIDIFDNK